MKKRPPWWSSWLWHPAVMEYCYRVVGGSTPVSIKPTLRNFFLGQCLTLSIAPREKNLHTFLSFWDSFWVALNFYLLLFFYKGQGGIYVVTLGSQQVQVQGLTVPWSSLRLLGLIFQRVIIWLRLEKAIWIWSLYIFLYWWSGIKYLYSSFDSFSYIFHNIFFPDATIYFIDHCCPSCSVHWSYCFWVWRLSMT